MNYVSHRKKALVLLPLAQPMQLFQFWPKKLAHHRCAKILLTILPQYIIAIVLRAGMDYGHFIATHEKHET